MSKRGAPEEESFSSYDEPDPQLVAAILDTADTSHVNRHKVSDIFVRARDASAPHITARTQRRAYKDVSTLYEMEDFYGEENAPPAEEIVSQNAFSPNWDFMHRHFLVGNVQDTTHLRPPRNESFQGPFVFQHTETTYGLNDEDPEIRLWGATEAGHSVLVRVSDFYPYFYAAVESEEVMKRILPKLEAHLYRTTRKTTPPIKHFVLKVEAMQGRSICGYLSEKGPLFKITVARPSLIPNARKCFDFGNRNVMDRSYPTYEANVPFELRYMIDVKLYGCQWIKLDEKAHLIDEEDQISNVQYEFQVLPKEVHPIPIEERGTLAPIRFLSYDIEVFRKEAGFPTPEKNPVVNICCALNVTGIGIVDRVVFALKARLENDTRWGGHNPIEGARVFEFEDERYLLMAFSQYVQECDPEGLTGWNTSSFDMPYLAGRAKAHGILDHFMSFSRIHNRTAWLREQVFQSKAYGAKKSTELLCEGRFDFDGLIFMLRGQMKKYRSYTLNHIASSVLGDTKLDVDYSQIPLLYESDDDEDRTRLALYCLKDAELPLQILERLMAVVNGVEQARVTGVSFKWLLSKGQGIKTFSNLLRHKLQGEYVPTLSPRSSTGETAGGHVEDPRRGWYPMPIITLDFASLYPSIIIAYNICYSTKVSRAWALKNLKPEDYWAPFPAVDGGSETDFVFVKKHIREGILPSFLAFLLSARRNVKGMMKTVEKALEPLLYSVLDGRQLALKVVCNSVYGFLKAFILRDKDLMSAVTSYGRNMIYKVKEVIQRDFGSVQLVDVERCQQLGMDPEEIPAEGKEDVRPRCELGAFIVYGDTDSVMVCFGDLQGKEKKKKQGGNLLSMWGIQKQEEEKVSSRDNIVPKHVTLPEMIRLGKEMAKRCTAEFVAPNSLTFETIKLRGGWLNKKRYFALEIEEFIPGERIVDAIKRAGISVKGLEGKRRDNAFINSATQNQCIRILLKENDLPKVERFIESRIADLLMGRVDMSELVITKGLAKTEEQYAKGGSKQLHVELQKRMRRRAQFTGEVVPETGDRVPYVIRASSTKEQASELSEHPLYALRNKVPINIDYYINKQIWPAVARVMTCVYEPHRCPDIRSTMPESVRQSLKVYKRFFTPDRLRAKKKQKGGDYGISGFTQVLSRCLGCGVQGASCCSTCDAQEIHSELEQKRQEQEARVKEAWDICRKCQGGSFNKVTCSNLTCKNFFHREQTLMDLEDLGEKLNLLGISKE